MLKSRRVSSGEVKLDWSMWDSRLIHVMWFMGKCESAWPKPLAVPAFISCVAGLNDRRAVHCLNRRQGVQQTPMNNKAAQTEHQIQAALNPIQWGLFSSFSGNQGHLKALYKSLIQPHRGCKNNRHAFTPAWHLEMGHFLLSKGQHALKKVVLKKEGVWMVSR